VTAAKPAATAVAARIGATAKTGSGQIFLHRLDQLIQVPGIPASGFAAVPLSAQSGEPCDQRLLILIGRAGIRYRLVLKMPAFPALLRAQSLRAISTRRLHRRKRRSARDHHLLPLTRRGTDPAQLHRADAGAVLYGNRLNHVTGQRLRHPLGTRLPLVTGTALPSHATTGAS
jgi:hypothetical protein